MKKSTFKTIALIGLGLTASLTSCSDDDEIIDSPEVNDTIEAPATYEFSRNGASSVSYSGQTERLNQLGEMKTLMVDATNNKTLISSQSLKDMFENVNGDGNGNFSFTSTKQLSNKTFDLDKNLFIAAFDGIAAASDSSMADKIATSGKSGYLVRSNGNRILVDANGHEFVQEIEKGLMGATFYNQIANVYLSDEKIGEAVNNTDLADGNNYTDMEHHFDEAFGYFGAPVDFESNYSGTESPRYWADYSNDFDGLVGLNDKLMNAFKLGRKAIELQSYSVLDNQVESIHNEFEVLIASAAIHYINSSLGETVDGNRMHTLTEGYFFLKALRYSNATTRKISQTDLQTMLDTDWGNDFWSVSETGLNKIKTTLSSTYGLNSVKDQL